MVGYIAAAVALLAVAFIVLIACSTYLMEHKECEEAVTTAVSAPMADAGNCVNILKKISYDLVRLFMILQRLNPISMLDHFF